jgi:hypothetical protein
MWCLRLSAPMVYGFIKLGKAAMLVPIVDFVFFNHLFHPFTFISCLLNLLLAYAS